jgi:hypothetical protein
MPGWQLRGRGKKLHRRLGIGKTNCILSNLVLPHPQLRRRLPDTTERCKSREPVVMIGTHDCPIADPLPLPARRL